MIGCGTGRCGTKSLNILFGSQPDTWVTHENVGSGFLRWGCSREEYNAKIGKLQGRCRPGRHYLSGNIAPWWLPCAEWLCADPEIKVVCIERNEEDTVRSLLRQRYDLFSENPRPGMQVQGADRNAAHPKFPGDRETAAHSYWNMYHDTAAAWAEKYPESFRVFDIDSLNSDSGQIDLLTFAGVDNPRPCPVSPGKYYLLQNDWTHKSDVTGEPDYSTPRATGAAKRYTKEGTERTCL